MKTTSARRVFISYARQSASKYADALYRALGGDDGEAFLDTSDIEAGDVFPSRIADAVLGARVFVVFADPEYFSRWYCLRELRVALAPYSALKTPYSPIDEGNALVHLVVALPENATVRRISPAPGRCAFRRGSGWCAGLGNAGTGVHRKLPHLGDAGKGVHRQLPHLMGAGTGVHRKLLHLGHAGTGVLEYMLALAERFRRVRVCCGDWSRVCGPTPTVKQGVTGVFLDPPYSSEAGRDENIYAVEDLDVAHAVRDWALEWGDDPRMRIALCGYEGEHVMPESWECVAWKAHGGYGSQGEGRGRSNAGRERIWFSPHCLRTTLFEMAGGVHVGD